MKSGAVSGLLASTERVGGPLGVAAGLAAVGAWRPSSRSLEGKGALGASTGPAAEAWSHTGLLASMLGVGRWEYGGSAALV